MSDKLDVKTNMYLTMILFRLATLCIDANTIYSIFLDSINQLKPPLPSDHNDPTYMNKRRIRKYYASINRVTLRSFVMLCADITKLVWPDTRKEKEVKEEFKDRNRRRQKRKENLEKLFTNKYDNLKNKEFRNFLEHDDDAFDEWNESNENHSITFDSYDGILEFGQDRTLWTDFNPNTFTITYYHKDKGSETTNVKEMYEEVQNLREDVAKALGKISGAPPNHFDSLFDLL